MYKSKKPERSSLLLKVQAAVEEISLADTTWESEEARLTQDQEQSQVVDKIKVQVFSSFWEADMHGGVLKL